MIVIGSQGIGKSTLAATCDGYIDLESGNFWIDGKRADDWYKPYCKIAESLSEQGYNVFVSSHEVVRKQLENSEEPVVLVYPSVELKDQWIDRLEKRYKFSGLEKDYKALMNAKDRYVENIRELESSPIEGKLCLTSMDYRLREELIAWCDLFYGAYSWEDDYDYDHCYECTGYGDDYYTDENGELVSACTTCTYNSANRDLDDDWDD